MKASDDSPETLQRARQGLYWRLLSSLFEQGDAAPNLEGLAGELAKTCDLPKELLDPRVTIDVLVHRFPKLKQEFARPLPGFRPTAMRAMLTACSPSATCRGPRSRCCGCCGSGASRRPGPSPPRPAYLRIRVMTRNRR